jgi:hypothetical protein
VIAKEDLIKRHGELIEYYNTRETSYGSQPISTFDFNTNKFNERNWSGGDNVIRQFVNSYVFSDNTYFEEFEMVNNFGDVAASSCYFNDQQYYHITLRQVENNGEWKFNQYLITFYKSRGATEWISKNGQTINFDEYVELLNIIEASGFKFDLKF